MTTPFAQPAAGTPDIELKSALELDQTTAGHLRAYRVLSARIAELEEARAQIRSVVEAALGDHEIGFFRGRPVVSWAWSGPTNPTGLDAARLRKEQPEIWAAYQKPKKRPRPFTLPDVPAGGDTPP